MANASPAGPAPTTARFFLHGGKDWHFGFVAGARIHQARGDFANEDLIETGLIAANTSVDLIGSSDCAFDSSSASARNGRAIDTISASPRERISSATCGSLIRLVVTSGSETWPFSLRVTQLNAPRGTGVAMVGIRASCQPMPVLIMVAPAASMACASSTVSAKSRRLRPGRASTVGR